MNRLLNTFLLSAALTMPVAMRADDHSDHDRDRHERHYRDEGHHDEHVWNDHEDRAYRIWVRDHHRHYHEFYRLRAEDQAAYWTWRHEHPDALLHIDIR